MTNSSLYSEILTIQCYLVMLISGDGAHMIFKGETLCAIGYNRHLLIMLWISAILRASVLSSPLQCILKLFLPNG